MSNVSRHINEVNQTNSKNHKTAKINEKGQADTVFEVLIAVILLGFVLFAGTLAMNSLSNTKCSKSIDITMNELKLKLEDAASSTLLSTEFLFNMPYCFGNNYTLALEKSNNAPLCSTYCPGSSGQCYLLDYDNNKDKVNPVRYTCVNISPLVNVNNPIGDCGDSEYSPLLPQTRGNQSGFIFTNGKYKVSSKLVSNNSVANSSNICIYKKASQ
jgi:hypothetical protein